MDADGDPGSSGHPRDEAADVEAAGFGAVFGSADFEAANLARMNDHLLGGDHNFAVDRAAIDVVLADFPDLVRVARAHRAFAGRAVRWCAEQGIEQFVDLGAGFPTVGSVHRTARKYVPGACVAYVDVDPVAVAHGRDILAAESGVAAVRADLLDPDAVLADPGVAGLLDLRRPVALLLTSVLHFVRADPRPALERYRAALAPGSALVLTHGCPGAEGDAVAQRRARAIDAAFRGATDMVLRGAEEIRAMFTGFDLVAPGLVDVAAWPEETDGPTGLLGGVGIRGARG